MKIEWLPVEELSPGESTIADGVIEELKNELVARYDRKHEPRRRDAHPKHHGVVTARLRVDPKCPIELQRGLFKAGAEFAAEIRFSNSHPRVGHDLNPDVRGMAIKLHGIQQPTLVDDGDAAHDFVLTTGEAFFSKDIRDFAEFPKLAEQIPTVIWYFFRRFRIRGGWRLFRGSSVPRSPLALEYFSQTPYRLGPHVVKYAAWPKSRAHTRAPWYLVWGIRHVLGALATAETLGRWLIGFVADVNPSARWIPGRNALRTALIDDLATAPAEYEFLVQRWPDLGQLPRWAIEDATRVWQEPWIRIATITIDRQDDIPAHDERAETMALTPWRALAEHQPLGSINRARLTVYREMAAFRRKQLSIRSGSP
jgi:hypothetical protein